MNPGRTLTNVGSMTRGRCWRLDYHGARRDGMGDALAASAQAAAIPGGQLSAVPRSTQTIPRVIFQVGATAESALKKHEKWMQTWWTLNPEYDYMLLSDEDCDSFVGAHASDDERRAYGVLRTGAQRADLFRVLWLKLVGGVYADLDLELRMPLRQAFDRAAGLDDSSRATNFREWAALPRDNRSEASLVAWDFSGWNFAFLAYERDHPLLTSVTRSIVVLVLGQWDAMRG